MQCDKCKSNLKLVTVTICHKGMGYMKFIRAHDCPGFEERRYAKPKG